MIGTKTVAILRQGSHNVLAASPKSRVNTITGENRYLKAVGDPHEVVSDPEARYWAELTITRSCPWARRASVASGSTNGSPPTGRSLIRNSQQG
jgi:hypothetical protein